VSVFFRSYDVKKLDEKKKEKNDFVHEKEASRTRTAGNTAGDCFCDGPR